MALRDRVAGFLREQGGTVESEGDLLAVLGEAWTVIAVAREEANQIVVYSVAPASVL